MKKQIIYGIECKGKKHDWRLGSDFYEEDEKEIVDKNIAYSNKTFSNSEFRLVKFERVN